MSDQDRERIRRLQDDVIDIAERCGYDESSRVSNDAPAELTLAALRHAIWPEYEDQIRQAYMRLKTPVAKTSI
jgi:hypothetical protein